MVQQYILMFKMHHILNICSCSSKTHHVEQLWTFYWDEVEAWFIGNCLSEENTVTCSETLDLYRAPLRKK